MKRVLSLGGGLDSWAMLLDAELRELAENNATRRYIRRRLAANGLKPR